MLDSGSPRDAHSALVAAQSKIENLNRAMVTAQGIGVAIGVLMATLGLSEQDAFNLLRATSQRRNEKLFRVAETVVLTGALPEGPRARPTPAPSR